MKLDKYFKIDVYCLHTYIPFQSTCSQGKVWSTGGVLLEYATMRYTHDCHTFLSLDHSLSRRDVFVTCRCLIYATVN